MIFFTTKRWGFTLIELLIVVAIIAILAAIAVPNFLEAQVRAKVSRCRADMRSIATALESYHVDNSQYPHTYEFERGCGNAHIGYYEALTRLTTPVSHITSVPTDPFVDAEDWWDKDYIYYNRKNRSRYAEECENAPDGDSWWFFPMYDNSTGGQWMLRGYGPDRIGNWTQGYYEGINISQTEEYDSTNGTMSIGDIIRYGP